MIIEADFFSQWLSVVEVYQDLSVSQRGGSYSALGCRLIGNCILWQRTVEYTNRPLLWDDWEAVFALCTEAWRDSALWTVCYSPTGSTSTAAPRARWSVPWVATTIAGAPDVCTSSFPGSSGDLVWGRGTAHACTVHGLWRVTKWALRSLFFRLKHLR